MTTARGGSAGASLSVSAVVSLNWEGRGPEWYLALRWFLLLLVVSYYRDIDGSD